MLSKLCIVERCFGLGEAADKEHTSSLRTATRSVCEQIPLVALNIRQSLSHLYFDFPLLRTKCGFATELLCINTRLVSNTWGTSVQSWVMYIGTFVPWNPECIVEELWYVTHCLWMAVNILHYLTLHLLH